MNAWNNLSSVEQELFNQVFAGLTLLDTLQSGVGAPSMLQDAESAHEEAVINNITFMESIHAKSYSTIFSTFCSPTKIDAIFEWIEGNEYLQYKANRIKEAYEGDNPYKRKIASVMLESFLFYSGFYTPLRYLGMGKMTNTAELIKLIVRDETVHGTFFGYKYRKSVEKLPKHEQDELFTWTMELASDLWANELLYTEELYGEIGLVEDVTTFLEYNLNKTLDNLGYPPLFSTTARDVNPLVMNGISTTTGNHDFFSQVGNGYLLGEVKAVTQEDFDLINKLI